MNATIYRDEDEVLVYNMDGTIERMTRAAHRSKLRAWIAPFARPGDDVQVSLDGASVLVFRRGAELPLDPGVAPWVCNPNPGPRRVETNPRTGQVTEILDFGPSALRQRPDVRHAVALHALKVALLAAIEPICAPILRWLSSYLSRDNSGSK